MTPDFRSASRKSWDWFREKSAACDVERSQAFSTIGGKLAEGRNFPIPIDGRFLSPAPVLSPEHFRRPA
jgi:hypothetical protein